MFVNDERAFGTKRTTGTNGTNEPATPACAETPTSHWPRKTGRFSTKATDSKPAETRTGWDHEALRE